MLNHSNLGVSLAALTIALASTGSASAQEIPPAPATQTSLPAGSDSPESESSEITVTATRVVRDGFDAPTPTLTLGEEAIRNANRQTIGEVLSDQPQFRAAGTPMLTNGSTNSSAAVIDLRGLGSTRGSARTLTLLDGHRFVGANDLNTIPQSIVKRIDVVTGGASAAWGSGAVAGVVNIILDDDLEGFNAGLNTGISSRGDGERYGGNLTYGTKFAGGRGHFMITGEYFRDQGLYGRGDGSRPNLDSNLFGTNSGQLFLADNVNTTVASQGGVITSGALAGMQFNPDGSLSPVPLGSQTNSNSTIGGNGVSGGDFQVIAAPYHRANAYARGTYEVSDALKLSADFNFTKMWDDSLSFPEEVDGSTTDGIVIQKDNAFLTPAVRAALASGPQTFFLGRIFGDPAGYETLKYYRRTLEGSLGASGHIGGSWSYDAYFDYGAIRQSQGFYNQRIEANFEQAIDAVRDPSGNIVCRVALTNPTTACKPLNIFGAGNASQAAINYAFANADQVNLTTTNSLLAAGGSIHGDPFSTWAGKVSVALGVDYREEKQVVNYVDPLSSAGALGSFNNAPGIAGQFDVKEGFAETVVPILDIEHVAKVDLNGAARYSDYSTSGGIWSWKYGGTVRLFDDFLLRGVYSRDIRSPNIKELYSTNYQINSFVIDPTRNNQNTPVVIFSGGNTALKPEISHTLTIGGTYSPHYIPGLHMSLDYYRIDINEAIASLSEQDIVNQCANGNTVTCAQITRDSSGKITTINSTYINLASYKTHGLDIDIAYETPLSRLFPKASGTLRMRSITNYVPSLIINDGVQIYNRAGDVGDIISFNVPKWRSTGTISYDSEKLGIDARVRYVGGGNYDSLSPIVNNKISSRTYLDLGSYLKIDKFTISANIQNIFDRDPPYVLYATPFYDVMGRYFSLSVKVKI
ncbi:TonB-dependent receptor [Sphingomonas oligophenolica]|uniref:TonB-dependent receptor n=1 Tax=Sphingomonas oligophenolica TaxID=301154 RepID=A0ABU9YAW9_9SPHN